MKEFLDKSFISEKFDAEKYNQDIIEKIDKHLENLGCILVDEVQFLTEKQIFELFTLTVIIDKIYIN